MIKAAKLPDEQRRELFRNTADKMGLTDAIVEKDFWVCFTLDYLFHKSSWKDALALCLSTKNCSKCAPKNVAVDQHQMRWKDMKRKRIRAHLLHRCANAPVMHKCTNGAQVPTEIIAIQRQGNH